MSRPDVRAERGFSMILVIIAMFVLSMFVAAAFAAANGDLPVAGISQDRKETYASAEAGLNYYLNHLQQDNDYWTKCDQVPAPNANEPNPVNQQWDGGTTDPRRWRTVPGSTSQYTIELLHTKTYSACDPTKQDSLVDLVAGTFKVRITGRPSATAKPSAYRSIIATFRRAGFLNYIYFSDFETIDPQALSTSFQRTYAQTYCANKYRAARAGKGCSEIQFVTNDGIKGPFHTNDDNVLVCGSPTFGRPGKTDVVEVSGGSPGYVQNGSSCSGTPTINAPGGKISVNQTQKSMPTSNDQLQDIAENGGLLYKGKTVVRLKSGGTMDITNYATGSPVTTTNVAWPANGVLFVMNNGACGNADFPTSADYGEDAGCGNVYVSGTYSKSMTIAAANDVIVRPTLGGKLSTGSADSDISMAAGSDALLGLIANNFVRIAHPVAYDSNGNCTGNASTFSDPVVLNVSVEAAILSLQHSFIVDNYNCGKLGFLNVTGAIAQKYRGPVGTGSGVNPSSGFIKNYTYDDRFRFRSPPYFLAPTDASWDITETHEQLPATRPSGT
jgi:hypothetical protein